MSRTMLAQRIAKLEEDLNDMRERLEEQADRIETSISTVRMKLTAPNGLTIENTSSAEKIEQLEDEISKARQARFVADLMRMGAEGDLEKVQAERDELEAKLEYAEARAYPPLKVTTGIDLQTAEHLARNDRPWATPAPSIPRVISADELEAGQLIAAWCIEGGTSDLMSSLGVVESTNGRDVSLRGDFAGIEDWHNVAHEDITIVLLAEAPAKEEPRLTVEDLDAAPVGSKITWPASSVGDKLTTAEELDACPVGSVVIDRDGDAWQKHWAGGWDLTGGRRASASDVARECAPLAVVHLPKEDQS